MGRDVITEQIPVASEGRQLWDGFKKITGSLSVQDAGIM